MDAARVLLRFPRAQKMQSAVGQLMFPFRFQKRGLDNKEKLPYFPYRDDSNLLLLTIKRMVVDYIYV